MDNSFVYSDISVDLTASEVELICFALSHTRLFLNHRDYDLWKEDIFAMKEIRDKLLNIEEG